MPPATKMPLKPAVATPERSLTQRMEALTRANEIRTRRAQLKRDLKAGRVSIHDLLLEPPDLRRDREGLRHAPGGAEVRPREGEQGPVAVPYLSEQDHRRPVPAAAHRAGQHAPPLAARGLGTVFVITGPSGVGKGTLIRTLLQRVPELGLAVSATTRRPRPGEAHGVDYHFLSDDEFERRVGDGEFVEHARYSGRRYGTLRSELEAAARGRAPGRARDRGPGRAPDPRGDARGGPDLHRAAERGGAARAARRARDRRPGAGQRAARDRARGAGAPRTSSPTS